MSNKVYLKAHQAVWLGSINWATDDIRAVLVDSADYTVNASTHEFLSDIPAGARLSVSATTTGRATTAGVLSVATPTFTSVPIGDGSTGEAVVFYKHTGTDSTSRLIVYRDTATSGLPVTPNGGNITVTFASGVASFAS